MLARMLRTYLLLLAAGCAGQVAPELSPANPCGAPAFTASQCTAETLNDGSGPDDHRQTCQAGEDRWLLYPSGEQWRLRDRDGGTEVLCHGAADGAVLWPVDGGA